MTQGQSIQEDILNIIDGNTVLMPNKDEIKVVKMIKDMVPDDVMRLGQELGLGIVRMKEMSLSSIHSDMAYAWLMRFDNVPQRSGDPTTWRALAWALSEMKCQSLIDKIIQNYPSQPPPPQPSTSLLSGSDNRTATGNRRAGLQAQSLQIPLAASIQQQGPRNPPPAITGAPGNISPGEFSASMTPGQLHDWLKAKQMPPDDCKIIKDKCIGGAVFHHIDEDTWKNFGVSPVGLILLKKVLMKEEAIPSAGHIQGQPPPEVSSHSVSSLTAPTQASSQVFSSAPSAQLSGKPTLPLFTNFPISRGNVNLAEEIGVHYLGFGIQLLLDDTGAQTSAIVKECQNRAEEINLKIFQKWLAGNGRQPLIWDTLVSVLQDIGLKALAQEIKLKPCFLLK